MLIPEILLNHHALAIASAFFGALSNILAKTILKDVTAKDILGINFLIMTGIMAVLSPSFFEINGQLITVIPIILLISAVDFFANFFSLNRSRNPMPPLPRRCLPLPLALPFYSPGCFWTMQPPFSSLSFDGVKVYESDAS
jgi:hypothetical protein